MAQKKPISVLDMLFALPWWVGAVFADAAFFAPNIAKQIYPAERSPEGLPVYNDVVHAAEGISLYLTVVFALFAAFALVRKTMTVRKKAHGSVQRNVEKRRAEKDQSPASRE